jgi:hypothetical protein
MKEVYKYFFLLEKNIYDRVKLLQIFPNTFALVIIDY